MNDSSKETEEASLLLDFAPERLSRLSWRTGLLGFVLFAAWLPAVVALMLDASPRLTLWMEVALLPVALGGSLWLPRVVLRMRQPDTATVSWTPSRVIERDGDDVRTALHRMGALAATQTTARHRIVQLRDAEGRAITIASGKALPDWLGFRKVFARELGSVLALSTTLAPLGSVPQPDARDQKRPTIDRRALWVLIALSLLAGVGVFFGSPEFLESLFCMLLALFFAVPALRPVHEIMELLAENNRNADAEACTLVAHDEDSFVVELQAGGYLRLSALGIVDPDCDFAAREGTTVHVRLPESGWVPSPTRASITSVTSIRGLERDYERRARSKQLRSAAIELLVRAGGCAFWLFCSFETVWLD